MKQFGETIKKLRKQKDMTQEQLAEYLNISTQAISKWETNLTLPDITLIPILANLFDVTTDTLLGVDIHAKEKCIDTIVKEGNNCLLTGEHEKAEKIFREALKEYPNSYRLMANLALVIERLAWQQKIKRPMREEVVALCEKIVAECTDDKVRNMAIQNLCITYPNIGEDEKALALANKMPSSALSNEYLLGIILKGREKYEHKQKEIAKTIVNTLRDIIYLNDNFADENGNGAYNLDECIALHHKVLDIINILFEDGNYGYYNSSLVDAHLHLTYFNNQKDDKTAALKHLGLAAKHAIMFDKIPRTEDDETEKEYTNLLFRGIKVGIYKVISPYSKTQDLLYTIKNQDFHSWLPSAEVSAIEEKLQESYGTAITKSVKE